MTLTRTRGWLTITAVIALVAGCSSTETSRPSPKFEELEEAASGFTVLAPESLPSGYHFSDISWSARGSELQNVVQTYAGGTDDPVVVLCVTAADTTTPCDEEDPSKTFPEVSMAKGMVYLENGSDNSSAIPISWQEIKLIPWKKAAWIQE